MNKKKLIITFTVVLVCISITGGYAWLRNKDSKPSVIDSQSSIIKDTSDNIINVTRSPDSSNTTSTNVTNSNSTVNDINAKLNEKNSNKIVKIEDDKYYLSDNRVINNDSLIDGNKDIAVTNQSKSARLYTLSNEGKNSYYIYSSPVTEPILINDNIKGTQITGVIVGSTETSLQLDSAASYKVSLNCVVYDTAGNRTAYSDTASKINNNSMAKILVVDNEVQNILIM